MRRNKTQDSAAVFWILKGDVALISKDDVKGKRSAKNIFKKADQCLINQLEEMLLLYESAPIALCLPDDIAFVIPSFMRSSGLYIAAIPSLPARSAAWAIENGLLGDIKIIGEPISCKRASVGIREQAEMLSEWLKELLECYGVIDIDTELDLSECIRMRALMIAEHMGISVRAVTVGDIRADERLDLGLFTSFMTVLLASAKLRSSDSSAVISIGEDTHGMYAQIDFLFEGQSPRYDRELVALHGIADRKRILFEVLDTDQSFSVRFSPVIEDWSLLEIKTPDGEELEFELT